MTIGIIGAMQMEIDNLKEAMEQTTTATYSGVEFVSGKIGEQNVVAAVCGIGKVFAAVCTEAMILKYDVDMIINIGVGGSLTKDLGVLDVAVAKNVVQHDMDTSPLGDPVGLLSGINMVLLPADERMVDLLTKCFLEVLLNSSSLTDFLTRFEYMKYIARNDQKLLDDVKKLKAGLEEEQKNLIRTRFEAIATEMEGGSIGHVCYINKIPFAILRSISDSEGGAMDYQTFAEKAAVQSIEVVLEFVERVGEIA